MKLIYLAYKMYSAYFKKEKTLFIFISIGIILCSLMLFIFTGFYFTGMQRMEEDNPIGNRITFHFENFNDFQDITDQILNKTFIDDIIYDITPKKDENIKISCYYDGFTVEKNNMYAGVLVSNSSRDTFNCEESFVQYYRDISGNILNVGSEMSIGGLSLKCTGIVLTNSFDVLIPYNALLEMKPEKVDITYVYKNGTSQFTIEDLNSEIVDRFNPVYVLRPQPASAYHFSDFLADAGNVLLLLFIAVINYMFIYRFLIKKRIYSYSILRLCGISNRKLYILIAVEMGILFSVSYILSYFVYRLGSYLWTQEVISISTMAYQLKYTFLTMLAVNFSALAILIKSIFKDSPHELYVKSVVE